MMEENVSFGELVNATVRVNNLNHMERSYDVSAEVTVSGNVANDFNNGEVLDKSTKVQLCSFSNYGNNLNVNLYDCSDSEKCSTIFSAITTFIADTRAKVSKKEELVTI